MMQLSFWKRLLCAALTLALGVTLTACSDDDTKDDKLIPEIEVTQSLTFDCTQTQTKNLEIELNGKLNWQIKADAWIELSQTSGKGSATVAVTVPANVTSRTGTITVTATGYMGDHRQRAHATVRTRSKKGRRIRTLRKSASSSWRPIPLPMEKN